MGTVPFLHTHVIDTFDTSLMCLSFTDLQSCQDTKLQAERILSLQERKQALEALLSSRVGELKQVCLLEAVSFAFDHFI